MGDLIKAGPYLFYSKVDLKLKNPFIPE